MNDLASPFPAISRSRVAMYAAGTVVALALGGYAIHEHHAAQSLAAKNAQATAQLNDTKHELSDLMTKVNMLVARNEAQSAPAASAQAPSAAAAKHVRPSAAHHPVDSRYKKLQAQLDAQGKAIEDTRSALAGTQGDLMNTRTELTGSIAHTHDELVLLEKKGERNYSEFDVVKSKGFEHKGPFGMRLRKANVKHQYADLELMVDDRELTQKHINLFQPVMFYVPDSPQPVEVVINDISKNHIHGYVSAPKYRQSELASMATATQTATTGTDAGIVSTAAAQPPARKRLTLPPQ